MLIFSAQKSIKLGFTFASFFAAKCALVDAMRVRLHVRGEIENICVWTRQTLTLCVIDMRVDKVAPELSGGVGRHGDLFADCAKQIRSDP